MQPRKTDQVFPVSLSEIAFTLVFLLMLLLGFMVLREREENDEAKARIALLEQRQLEPLAAAAVASAMTAAQSSLAQTMAQAGAGSPEQVAQMVQEFINAGEQEARQLLLQQEVLDLTRRLVALEELRNRVEQAGHKVDEQLTREEVEQAIALRDEVSKLVEPGPVPGAEPGAKAAPSEPQKKSKDKPVKPMDSQRAIEQVRHAIAATKELREQAMAKLGVAVPPGQEPVFVREVIEGARQALAAVTDKSSPEALKRENANLRATVAFYDKRDKLRGLDHPPCWMDANSKIEYIFNVQTTAAGFVVTRGWLPHREAHARASAGFNEIMAGGDSPVSGAQFSQGAKPFLDYGKAQSPECRHFVYLSSTISDADRRDEARRLVNGFFYVLERKSPVTP
ncbi:MAG: hypothetical protein R3E94_14370 [Burkholderiaceae bacterium]